MIRRKHHQDEYKFGREDTLRSWIKDWLGNEWWRIEPSQGSTFGLPDGFIMGPNRRTLFIELKICRIKNGKLAFDLTPAQKRNFPKLIAQGACLTIVAAEFETNRVWLVRGDERFKNEPIPYFSEKGDGVAMITAGQPELLVPTILLLHDMKPLGRAKNDSSLRVKKFELTTEQKPNCSYKLFRVRALRDIPRYKIKAGDLGGWLADAACLSQAGDCWVGGDAEVMRGGKVSEDACVVGQAKVMAFGRVMGSSFVGGKMVIRRGEIVGENSSRESL